MPTTHNLKFKIKNLKFSRGFTLIELLIVIAILGIVSSIVTVGMSGQQRKARDAQRKNDLQTIKKAMQAAKNDCRGSAYYPAVPQPQDAYGSSYHTQLPGGNSGDLGYLLMYYKYLNTLPLDPKYVQGSSAHVYMYNFQTWPSNPDYGIDVCPDPFGGNTWDGVTDYRLIARPMEVTNDPDIAKSQQDCPDPVYVDYSPTDYVVCP